ncbi:VWA domain-containing protein [Chloroflexi bacterium TSY]|nr:VWA domain-containing protein [Chloroflexi bacterium TSY]
MTIRFAAPWFLTLLLLLPLLVALTYHPKRRQPVGILYANVGIATTQIRSWRLLLHPVLPILRWLVLALLIVALARPQTVDAQQIIKGEGVDIALALDISGSMASLDFEPDNRLQAAKQVIQNFVAERPYDRIGLTVFAKESFSQSPLTIDHAVLARLLNQVELATDLRIEDGTAIGLGLANAANMLKESTAKSRIVVLLTDGVNNAGQIDLLTAAEAARTLGIRVYTIGMGRPGQVPMPQQTLFGQRVVMVESVLDEETLMQIAEKTGGLFFRAEDTAGLQQVYDEINALEKSEIEIRTFHRYTELSTWLLASALVLMLTEVVMGKTLLRKLP